MALEPLVIEQRPRCCSALPFSTSVLVTLQKTRSGAASGGR